MSEAHPEAWRWKGMERMHFSEHKPEHFLDAEPLYAAVWHPIDSAPSDVEVQLGWIHWHSKEWMQKVGYAHSTKGGWWDGSATHWMPLLPGPSISRPPKGDAA